jgi:hypothetical protein
MHYKDGSEAKVGDLVKGTAYNTKNPDGSPRVIVGTMLQITPGSETCNCVVSFAETAPLSEEGRKTLVDLGVYYMIGGCSLNAGPQRIVGKYDYSECRAFELVHRPA